MAQFRAGLCGQRASDGHHRRRQAPSQGRPRRHRGYQPAGEPRAWVEHDHVRELRSADQRGPCLHRRR
ncbi:hypothetical protein ACFPRL_06205 [Pseudoclavibacter helvolus]